MSNTECDRVKCVHNKMCNYLFELFNAQYTNVIDCNYYEEERPHGEWIPVSERLPEGKIDPMTNDFELVLCSTVWEVVRPYKFGKPIGHSKAHFWSGGGIMDDYVIAWKPMPEPYKEDAEDE